MTFARTKIQPPRARSAFVERGAVQTRLGHALLDKQVVLLCAPAGYGKTMLLAQEVSRLPAGTALAWISVDPGDDLQRLLECMLAALEAYDPPWRTAPESLVARVADSIDAQRDVAAEIINTLDACAVDRGVIVFDDVHRVEDPDFFRVLDRLIERLSARWCVVLTSRTEPPVALARLRATDDLAEFRQLHLQFARDEARRLAREAGLDDALADRLFDRTQGWPAGMRIAIGAVRGSGAARASEALRASERPLFEFLVAEVLQQLPPALAEFLLDVSVLPELESGRCREVTGNDRAAARLDAIERLGLFVDVLDAPVRTLRLHDLFRDALQLRLQQQDPARLARLRRRAATTEPDPARRLSLLIDAGDTDAAAALAFDHLPSLIPAAGPASALHLTGQFPAGVREQAPELAFVRGLAAWSQWEFPLALAQLERAERGFAERGDRRRMEMARAESLMPLMAAGRLAEAAERLATFRLEELPTTTRIVVMNAQSWLAIDECRYAAVAPIVAAMLELLQGHSDRLDLWYQTTTPLRMPGLPGITPVLERRAALELQVAGDAPTPLRTLGLLTQAWCAVCSGNLDGARERMQAARSEAQWCGHSGAVRTHLFALTAVAATIAGDPARAIEAAEGRLQISGNRAPPWQRYLTRLFCARIAACCEHRAELQNAWRLLETERASIGALASPQGTRAREGAIAAQLAWLEGRAEDALAGWERAVENDEEIDLMGQAAEVRVRLARALARRGDLHAAADRLAPVFSRVSQDGRPGGVLLAGDALRELAAVRWGRALAPPQQVDLQAWWKIVAAERVNGAGAARAAGPAATAAGGAGHGALTAREMEVLARIAAGDSNKLIARAFDLSLHTVKRHVANILTKLGADTRGQAAAWYRAHG
ncbi:MAG TPA: LuxR C-terminal-related transcriptional regulator [Burkholderiaceae bacterium]|nr:LuxR C-terminal-related transcriptional regulator [Burkholderiaceae bacterium]